MKRLIPGRTKVQVELFKGVRLTDLLVAAVALVLLVFVLVSSLPGKLYFSIGALLITAALLARIDTQPNYIYLLHILRHFALPRGYKRFKDDSALLREAAEGAEDVAFHKVFDEADEEIETELPVKETDRQRRERQRTEKRQRAEEDKLLKSSAVSDEVKQEIRERRRREWEISAKKLAAAKDAAAKRRDMRDIIAFTGIKGGCIEYAGKYYGAAIEIQPLEFRFLSPARRQMSIEGGVGRILRGLNPNYAANIVKLERPVNYDLYLKREYEKLDEIKQAYESGLLSEPEYQARVEVLYDRLYELQALCADERVVTPFYYLVLFESDRRQLEVQVGNALQNLRSGEMEAHRLNDKELALFLRHSNEMDFNERDIDRIRPESYGEWAMPETVDFQARTVTVDRIVTHNMRVVGYPSAVDDAWLATVMSMPGTKCVVKCRPMDRAKAVRGIDRSLQELRGQYAATGIDSRRVELEEHIATLNELLVTLRQDNETLLEMNIYVTAYDLALTQADPTRVQPEKSLLPVIADMKKTVRRAYSESGFRLNNLEFDQVLAFIGGQISGYDPFGSEGRGVPSNSLAAGYPWVFAHVSDEGGIKLGTSDGVPVFIDFFRRDSERVNSNMVIVGKSGSGKSYATKSLLTNLAAEDAKIFILDPENEYTELAQNLHGKFINVGNAQYGRLNPFHIITALDDDAEGGGISGSYATHLQFLEEFFRQILPDCDKDAMEYLNSLIDRMYTNRGITAETDLSRLRPEDYPVFDDLYDAILAEFQQTDNAYIRSILRTLMNYIAKFSTGGRNANIWNGPSTVTTEENFIVFNFQSLLANRNSTIANAQMLLVLKYIDNEIIKNRDYNTRYGLHRKIVVAIDEAHVFIDSKFPVALDFMFQLAKRIRKYNGMQIVITQNIKDFVGSEEIARKSTAIINACQYSFIFSLSPNDMQELCRLYEKAGGINESEQEQITSAPRGQAFAIMSPASRTSFRVTVPEDVVDMFEKPDFQSRYFSGEDGLAAWEDVVGSSREKNLEKRLSRLANQEEPAAEPAKQRVFFQEVEDVPEPEAAPAVVVEDTQPAAPALEAVSADAQEQHAQAAEAGTQEKLLAELLSRFSHESMVEEIRRAVRQEVEQELESRRTQPESAAPAAEIPATQPFTQPQAAGPAAYEAPQDDIDWDDMYEGADDLLDVPESEPQPISAEVSDEDTLSTLEVAAMLRQAAQERAVSPIDRMEERGESVIEVTLEELAQYNSRKESQL